MSAFDKADFKDEVRPLILKDNADAPAGGQRMIPFAAPVDDILISLRDVAGAAELPDWDDDLATDILTAISPVSPKERSRHWTNPATRKVAAWKTAVSGCRTVLPRPSNSWPRWAGKA